VKKRKKESKAGGGKDPVTVSERVVREGRDGNSREEG